MNGRSGGRTGRRPEAHREPGGRAVVEPQGSRQLELFLPLQYLARICVCSRCKRHLDATTLIGRRTGRAYRRALREARDARAAWDRSDASHGRRWRNPTPAAVTRIKPSDTTLIARWDGVSRKMACASRTLNHSSDAVEPAALGTLRQPIRARAVRKHSWSSK